MFGKYLISATAITLFAMANPASATNTANGSEQLRAKVVKRGNQTLYCVPQAPTGTRVSRQICMTEQELAQSGAHIERAKGPMDALKVETARAQ